MIHKITPSVDYWLKHLNTRLNELSNQNSIKIPKVVDKVSREEGDIGLFNTFITLVPKNL